jgi:hypothetical protein
MSKTEIKKTSAGKKLVYVLILVAIVFFITESVLSIAYYQSYGGSPLATVGMFNKIKYFFVYKEDRSVYYKSQQLARPDSSAEMSNRVSDESIAANGYAYQPWVGYSAKPFEGKYLNINGLVRKSVPERNTDVPDSNAVTIYFIGGSTMFGFNVADFETIPSQFVQLYKEKQFKTPIRIVNYGVPTYSSYHELMLLTQLLYNDHHPHIAVFLDGLNDCMGVRTAVHKMPLLNYRMKEAFVLDIRRGNPVYEDSLEYMFKLLPGSTLKGVSDSIYSNYLSTKKNIETISATYGVRPYFFIQPVAFYNYPNQKNDPVCSQQTYPQFSLIYQKLEERLKTDSNFRFLGNMLSQEKGIPFVDGFHYSPSFNKKIAASILDKIAPVIHSIQSKQN